MMTSFLRIMAINYRNQGLIEKMSVKTEQSSYRLSDQRNALCGGRGSKYDELVYLRGQNGDSETVNTKPSNAWMKFALANGSKGSRYDEVTHIFSVQGSYP